MSVTTKDAHQLTVELLARDEAGYDIGYWGITTKLRDRKQSYILVRDDKGYTLAKSRPFTIIGRDSTIEGIVDLFNQQLSDGEVLVP